jgi:hypothetical protein
MQRLPGWINVDLLRWPEVDHAIDVTKSFPFADLELVFAEHFIEHLTITEALDFLARCHRALGPDGRLRISTPNLEWVWQHLDPRRVDGPASVKIEASLHANRAFYGWGHRFIWNAELLSEALRCSGFGQIEVCRYGESRIAELRGLERHERDEDTPDLPHVLIFEAVKGIPAPAELTQLRERIYDELVRYV